MLETMKALDDGLHFETPSGPAELRRAEQGYLFAWPQPTAEQLAKMYGEDYYASDKPAYFEKTERELDYWNAVWDMRRQILEQHLPQGQRSILDVGCAGGFLLDRFRQGGWQVHGVEPSKRAVAFAKDRYDLDLFCGPVEDYTQNQSVSAIHASQVLEHLLDPKACLEKMVDLLAPGGLVFLEVPNEFNALQGAVVEQLDKQAWWIAPKHHLNYFDHDSLAQLCESCGLTEVMRLGSFPMEMLALMGMDYIGCRQTGTDAHSMRMQFEMNLVQSGRQDVLIGMQQSFAAQGLGRTACLVARKA
ncbi:MAG: 2-polyprenyl-3-methyl-5-hydroxy-6-metoxy-1,4-benzoquinol methylase [Planctomycetota bacterium]|jgi:2-polyprenyl-3-methyl-5-hydroxy-6-metoxy-1,4-benzoquinol methylase